jgi:hypothetical protein
VTADQVNFGHQISFEARLCRFIVEANDVFEGPLAGYWICVSPAGQVQTLTTPAGRGNGEFRDCYADRKADVESCFDAAEINFLPVQNFESSEFVTQA